MPSRVCLSVHISWPSSNKSHPSVGKPSEVTIVHFIKQLESCMSQEHISFVHWYEPIRQRHRFSALVGNLEISGDKQKFVSVSVSLEMAHLQGKKNHEILKGNTQPWGKMGNYLFIAYYKKQTFTVVYLLANQIDMAAGACLASSARSPCLKFFAGLW